MARSDTYTYLPLDRWAEIMRIPLTHFNQQNGPKAPRSGRDSQGGCQDVWDQDDHDDLAWVLSQAENLIIEQLQFYPVPAYIANEEIPLEFADGIRWDWRYAEVKTDYKYLDCLGTETLTLLEADATVSYLDLDNDPFEREETARIGGSLYEDLPACADECNIRVFFRVADGAKDAADPNWEIRPLKKVDIDGTTMRIDIESSLLLKPSLRELTKQECAGSDDIERWRYNWELGNLVTAVDVYCSSLNSQSPVTIKWDGVCDCTGACAHKTQTACGRITNKRAGAFQPRASTWNGTTNVLSCPTYSTIPEFLTVNYHAGFPLKNCRMDSRLERAIVKLSNALMPNPPCGFCDEATNRWVTDRVALDPNIAQVAGMPWDIYYQGALDAWKIVKQLAYGRGGHI